MAFFVYVLKSDRNEKRYVGYTGKTPLTRVKEHNSGTNKFTKENKPFRLIYWEEYPDKTSSIKRERFLKSGQGRKFLDGKLNI